MKQSNISSFVITVMNAIKTSIVFLVAIICLVASSGGGGGGGGGSQDPPATETLNFSLQDFNEIEVEDSFEIVVQQGSDFAIEITVDEGLGSLVEVKKVGTELQIGFRDNFTGDIRSTITEGVVTMPAISSVELLNSARVDMDGLSGSSLQINLSGSSSADISNGSFDLVFAMLSGSSQLSMVDVVPLPDVNAELTGSSMATLNMLSGGDLIGFATGSSKLAYFGSNLTLNVTTSGTATVTRLGDTLP